MIKKRGKEIYQPPYAQDLSGLGANGQEVKPKGMCIDGSSLTFEICQNGESPVGGSCSPNGISPEYGYCDLGNTAVEGCASGSAHF
jgi:hypothetical protein